MSSHHIVREKQEPALLVLSLDNFTDDELGQLLEWSPTLVAGAAVAEQLSVYGIKLDYIVTANSAAIAQPDLKIIDPGSKTYLEAALDFLVAQGYPAVNIVSNRFDMKVLANYTQQINQVMFCNRQKIYPVSSGFRKWKPAGELVKLLHNTTVTVQTQGLEQTGPNEYRTLHDGFFGLTFALPYLFVAEQVI